MTRKWNRTLLISLAFTALGAISAAADPPSIVGRLNLAEGAVSFKPGSLDDWVPAELNYALTAGDHLWADEGSRAEVHVGSSVIRLDGGTEVSFLNLDDQATQIALTQGAVNVRLWRLDPGEAFEIDTPNSVVTLLQPGSYTVSVQGEEGTSVAVRSGQAEVSASGNDFNVPVGQMANLSGSGSIAYYLTPLDPPSAWDAWWAARDAREQQFASLRYVPRDMIGAEDLDDSGTWIVLAGYGPCWTPRNVPLGWAPYRFGRWAWVAPWGWTWIDAAPWGFAPFHYGRWAFVTGRWVWLPGSMVARPVYAPALVVFVGGDPGDPTAAGIGWFPLGPREVYVPPYAVSPTYVQRVNITTINITVVNIERINVTQVTYVNRNAPSAVTMVPRQMFTAGRPTTGATISFTMDQARRAPIIGMGATVAPQRESIIGQPMAPAPRPPEQVVGRPVFGRLVPAPAPQPFIVRPEPLPPVTVYQRPPQAPPPPAGPVRQPAPVMINPMRPQPQPQQPQQPPAMRPSQPQPPQPQQPQGMMRPPQPQPPQPQQPQQPPAMRPSQPQPPQAQQPQGMMRPPQPQPPQPQQPPAMRPSQPQPPQPQQPPAMRPSQPQPPQPQQPQGTMRPPQPVQPRPAQPQGQQPQAQPQQPVQPQQPGSQASQGDRDKEKDNQGRGKARSLLNELKIKTLPDTQRKLEAARKNPGSNLDFAALSRQLEAARSAINAAENTLSSGNADAAFQQAQAAQRQLQDVDQQLSSGG
jgi:hypothetical protein